MMVDHIADARKLGVEVLPPDVNRGMADFDVLNNSIVFGLTAIKGLGRGAAEEIVRARDGRRASSRTCSTSASGWTAGPCSKAAVEKMIKAGAFDASASGPPQFAAVPQAWQAAEEKAADRKRGQKSIFDAVRADGDGRRRRTAPRASGDPACPTCPSGPRPRS